MALGRRGGGERVRIRVCPYGLPGRAQLLPGCVVTAARGACGRVERALGAQGTRPCRVRLWRT